MREPVINEEVAPSDIEGPAKEVFSPKERVLNMDDEAEKLIVGNIAATDYFVFDRAFNERKSADLVRPTSQHHENTEAEIIETGTPCQVIISCT